MGRPAEGRARVAAVDDARGVPHAATALMRAFVAARLPDGLAAMLAEAARDMAGPELRLIPVENLHVTVHFLGAFEDARAGELAAALAAACAAAEPLEIRFEAIAPGPPRRPRMLWAQGRQTPDYDALVAAVAAAAAPFAPDAAKPRPGGPHVTLARLRGRALLGRWPEPVPLDAALDVAALVLMRSDRGPGGSRYTPLAELALR